MEGWRIICDCSHSVKITGYDFFAALSFSLIHNTAFVVGRVFLATIRAFSLSGFRFFAFGGQVIFPHYDYKEKCRSKYKYLRCSV